MDNLNPQFCFERFVVCDENQAAYSAAIEASDFPGKIYNPLVICGGVGLGKTHLLNAIGQRVSTNFPDLDVCFMPSEAFMNNVANAYRYNKIAEFRTKWKRIDVLLVDSIQFIANKEMTQKEMVYLLNVLLKRNRQIVLTADHSPMQIQGIDARLKAIIARGRIVHIRMSTEIKSAVLQNLAEEKEIVLPLDVAEYIASNIDDNIRLLEGFVMRLASYAKSTGDKITMDVATKILFRFMKD
jgi:chromosomal replication initiator protein